ncbi:choice-of-anchor L domain-containing protein [Flavobacterium humi]|uniref:T9SS type B sorting domain-containing protein n=1 Tax=Flavobacterium humi TaxID=2562683 RepID=A0A4Z0L8H1_9FLAO|nr:choice-of-anchor L domain-containing protein [Flavobacterium humi]TGD58084.1 T9SS type B sorting domain-containing protein [Flavobacterium humi]
MKSGLQVFFLSVVLFFSEGLNAQYITIDESYTAQQLVQDILVNSGCASVSNFSATGGNFNDGSKSYAYFTNASSSFPFTNGIVLATGKASSAQGPNTYISDDGGSMAWPGDPDLEQALGLNNTVNRTVLEFDFIPQTDKISFDYIFASEEYHDNAQCRYSDGFAFLLKKIGSTAPYQNLAVVPGTTIPVKVTSVHPDVPGSCAAQNESYFGSYNDANHPTNFNGQTVVMTAQSDVEIGQAYHIKLVIADEGNFRYDSAIFLKAGSFQSAVDLGPDRLIATNNPYCSGASVTFNAAQSGTNTYKWFKNGIDTGITTPTYTVTDNTNPNMVTYSVEVTINGTCTSSGEIKIQFADLPVLANKTLVQCDDNHDGISVFNLNNAYSISGVTFFETFTNAQNNTNPIQNTAAYQNTVTSTVYAKVSNAYGCVTIATVTLQIANNSIPAQNDIEECDQDGQLDGETSFTLPVQLTGIPAGLTVSYFASVADAVLQANPLSSPYRNTTPDLQIIYARVINGPDCYGIVPIRLVVHTFNPPYFEDVTVGICSGNIVTLSVNNGFSTYTWSNGDTDAQTDVSSAGIYSVEVTNTDGCKAVKEFTVQASAPASDIDAVIEEFQGNANTVLITYTDNGGNYVFSMDGANYQNSPYFTNVPAGEYTISVKDLNGCLPTPSKVIYVLDYPAFFTPNADGIHDIWAIRNGQLKPGTIISVFDRFGKLIKQFNSNSSGWDGTYNGQKLPSDDYWFTLDLSNGNIIKGHFSLKR